MILVSAVVKIVTVVVSQVEQIACFDLSPLLQVSAAQEYCQEARENA